MHLLLLFLSQDILLKLLFKLIIGLLSFFNLVLFEKLNGVDPWLLGEGQVLVERNAAGEGVVDEVDCEPAVSGCIADQFDI